MLQSKKFNIFLSVVIALLLWMYVIGEVNPTTTKKFSDVPVTLLNTESLASKGLTVLGEGDLTVDLTVEGKRADVLSAGAEDILVTADLFGYEAGENHVTLGIELPGGLTLVSSNPVKLPVTIDQVVTEERSVILGYSGTAAAGTEAGQLILEPETVEINGASTLVAQVAYVGATMDLSQLTEDLSAYDLPLSAYSGAGEEIDQIKLSQDSVRVSGRLMAVKTVPLRIEAVGEEPAEVQLVSLTLPGSVSIRGDRQVLETVTEIRAQDIDLSEYTASTSIPIRLILPDGVEAATASQNLAASLTLRGLDTRSFQLSSTDVEISSLAEGFEAEIQPTTIIVTLTGKAEALAGILQEDIRLSLSLSGLEEGVHQAEVAGKVDGYTGTVSLAPQAVSVEIRALT